MKYAVISISGHQYKVSQDQEILVDKLSSDPNAEVLLIVDEDKVTIGDPSIKGAKVVLSKVEDLKGEKITVFKYKSKSRYRKKRGFRAQLTKLKVGKISSK